LHKFEAVKKEAEKLRIPAVTIEAAQYLRTLVKITRSLRVLEIGTGNAYSSLCIESVLPDDGLLVTVENDLRRIKFAIKNINDYSNGQISLVAGDGQSVFRISEYFDFIFIDGRKYEYPQYLKLIDEVLKPGGTFLIDNAFFQEMIFNENPPERFSRFVPKLREMFELLLKDKNIEYSILDNFDGMVLGWKK
ncbi:class I SAM-dependent methyltransferase, partial [bacterium]|nr:class I SAM-dependent methyltransferase [bacterium]